MGWRGNRMIGKGRQPVDAEDLSPPTSKTNPANNQWAWEKNPSLRWEHGLVELLFQPSETLSPPGKQNWGKLLI